MGFNFAPNSYLIDHRRDAGDLLNTIVKNRTRQTLIFASDGSAQPNPGHSAFGLVTLRLSSYEEYSQYLDNNYSNNDAELFAIGFALVKALEYKAKHLPRSQLNVYLASDSQYALQMT